MRYLLQDFYFPHLTLAFLVGNQEVFEVFEFFACVFIHCIICKFHERVGLFLIWIVALVLVVALVVAVVIAVAALAPFAFLSLLLGGSTVIGVVGRILAMQETVEFLFSVVFVAVITTGFLVPVGFFCWTIPYWLVHLMVSH